MTPAQSPLVFLRSSATKSALQQSTLGTLSHPSGRLLSDHSFHCSTRKLQAVLNKVFCFFFQHTVLLGSSLSLFHPGYLLIHFTFLSFPRSSASLLPACEAGWWRQRLRGSSLCSDWSNGGLRSGGQNTLQPISAFPANRDRQKLRAGLSERGEQF